MEFEIRGTFLSIAEEIVHIGDDMRTRGVRVESWKKRDKSHASRTDVDIERMILDLVRKKFPGMPILSEEEYPNMPETDTFVSVDPCDGTAAYLAGRPEWAISLALILRGVPMAGLVVQPVRRLALAGLMHTGVQKYDYRRVGWFDMYRIKAQRPMIGSDLGPDSPDEYWDEVRNYVRRTRQRPVNLPAVAAGVDMLMGNTDGWWSHTAHHWDMAGNATLIREMGGVIECIDGSPVPWTSKTKLPPMLIADSRQTADRIHNLIALETNHKRYAVQ